MKKRQTNKTEMYGVFIQDLNAGFLTEQLANRRYVFYKLKKAKEIIKQYLTCKMIEMICDESNTVISNFKTSDLYEIEKYKNSNDRIKIDKLIRNYENLYSDFSQKYLDNISNIFSELNINVHIIFGQIKKEA